jgi:hypothetical protein
MRECRLADQLDCARAMPRQLRQLQYKRFEGRAKLVLRCARHGRIGELALCRCAKLRNDLCNFGHARPRDRMGL